MLDLWKRPAFRWLAVTAVFSYLGDQLYLVALPWLALQLTGSSLALGTVLMAAALPRALFICIRLLAVFIEQLPMAHRRHAGGLGKRRQPCRQARCQKNRFQRGACFHHSALHNNLTSSNKP